MIVEPDKQFWYCSIDPGVLKVITAQHWGQNYVLSKEALIKVVVGMVGGKKDYNVKLEKTCYSKHWFF